MLEKHQVVVSKPHQVPTHDSLFAPPSPTFEDEKIDESLNKKGSICHRIFMVANFNGIFYWVPTCAKMQNKPIKILELGFDKILQYLASTKSLGIVYQRHPASTTVLSGYADASFASEDESLSRVGYFYLFKDNLVSWTSDNINWVVISSTEAECRVIVQFTTKNICTENFILS